MTKILLLDVDSTIPNLALMKLSGYYKDKGFNVDFKRLKKTGYPTKNNKKIIIDGDGYDKIFASIIFTSNKDVLQIKNCDFDIGGTGVDIIKKLPDEIDNHKEDYSIYPDNNKSFGFITRGCIRNCWFCFVPKKEGKIKKYRDIKDIVRHENVVFMDNNILGYHDHIKIFQEILDLKIKVTFNQGLDIRLLNDNNASLLSKMRYQGEYIFAFDDIKSLPIMNEKVAIFKKYIPSDWKGKFYIYCNPKEELSGIMQRVNWCRQNKVLPYIMRDFSCYSDANSDFYTDTASWCNQPGLFKNMSFEEFINKRTKNQDRISKTLELWNS